MVCGFCDRYDVVDLDFFCFIYEICRYIFLSVWLYFFGVVDDMVDFIYFGEGFGFSLSCVVCDD